MHNFGLHFIAKVKINFSKFQKRDFFIFHFFDDFLTAFAKKLMKKPPVFMIYFKSSYKILLSYKDLRSKNYRE